MAKLPDGHVFIYRLMKTKIEIEERELVMCKHCKHHRECDYWIENGNEWFCADGEREDAENH